MALKRIGIDTELVGFSEIDKYAVKSYCAVHGVDESLNLGDISKINLDDLDEDIELITHGSPCQDFSLAGLQRGGDKGSETRSSLMWCTVDIVEKVRPKYVVWENVKNLLSKAHRHNFDNYLEVMESLGYNNYYKVLNAKDYGIPQNRERVYTISIRKDIDKGYEFPEKEELKIRLKNLLEDEVDEKYYLDDKPISCSTLYEKDSKDPKCIQVGKLDMKGIDQIKRFYSPEGLSPTLTTMGGGQREPKIIEEKLPGAYGRNFGSKGKLQDVESICDTLVAAMGNGGGNVPIIKKVDIPQKFRIRKLTPKECWRLMGFSDEDFEKARAIGTSNTQLYKQAGNSIVVNVLEAVFRKMRW